MSESENFGHEHPLVLNEGQSKPSERAYCSRCWEEVSLSTPSFSCVECEFHLHKKCAEAPSEMNHPFHPKHPLLLLQSSPYAQGSVCICDFCDKICKASIFHCSCGLDFHIACALFTYNIAQKNVEEFQHVALQDPLISTGNYNGEELESFQCFGCWKPLLSSTYFSLDCGFHLHKKCAELPLKINHMCHRKHPLVLQFNSLRLSCNICQETRRRGFVYCCLPCKVAVHIECVPPSPDKSHQHPFTLFWRRAPFICDACGTEGNHVAYICTTCNIMVHKQCTSLPRIIKSRWHHHHIFHTYFLHDEDLKNGDCVICHDEVNAEHGSYYCSDCKIIAHVNCATKNESWYYIVSPENEDEKSIDSLALLPSESIDSITCVIERNDAGEATKVKHFKHMHELMLSEKIAECDKYCEGCMLPISASFYYCLECDFFLHKACAELPKMKHVWFHDCQQSVLILTSDYIFRCHTCRHLSNGFAYKCNECDNHVCLRCVSLTPDTLTCQGHKHPLLFYVEYEGKCCGCGDDMDEGYCCKGCNFALCVTCVALPTTTRHKCDEHVFVLTYKDDNDYSECHYCDICEERRNSNYWFYHCATCDTSAHKDCVLEDYRYIKLGSTYKEGDHPHPLIFVKKIYYYPQCIECGEPCKELALECATLGCNYIVHWKCTEPIDL